MKYPNPEKALIQDILFYFNQFPLTFGWYTTGIAVFDEKTGNWKTGRDSDFFILRQRCLLYNLDSPFEIGYSGNYITLKKDSEKKHIDLIKVFEKQVIKDNVFAGKYRTTSLDAVSSALLGITKYDNMSAGLLKILEKPIEEQKRYVRRDAELVMLLAQYNNCLVLRLMKVFSQYAEMDYYKVCHTNVSKWYENKYKKMIEKGECNLIYTPFYKLEKKGIGGGHHTKPKRGFFIHTYVYELDVKGMYPTIVKNNNLSFDTLNCICCKGDSSAYLSQETINIINGNLKENKIDRQISNYWVCRKRRGAFPLLLEQVLNYREKYLQLLKEEKAKPNPTRPLLEEYQTYQIGAKLFANSGFGLFANENFEFSNYKVAECITAEGRRIHKQMELLCTKEPFNFDIVFGFTDSIFIRPNKNNEVYISEEEIINHFILKCKKELGITVEIKNKFVNSIFYGKKNRCVGWSGNEKEKEPVIKGLDGLANSNPLWIRKWFYEIVKELVKNPKSRFDVIPKLLNEAIFDLKYNICTSTTRIEKELKFTQRLKKHPDAYDASVRTGVLGRLLEKDKGEEVYFYEIIGIDNITKGCYSISVPTRPEGINMKKYKGLLLDKLKDTLEITGFNTSRIRLELVEDIVPFS